VYILIAVRFWIASTNSIHNHLNPVFPEVIS